MKTILFVISITLFCAVGASAQVVTNPGHVEYTASADHATLTKYVIGFFLPGATDPVQSADLPLGTPDAQQKIEQPITTVPLGYGTYIAKMKAVAGTLSSEWSTASNEFSRIPLPPTTAPIVKK